MSPSYRIIGAHELDAGLIDAWRSIQGAQRVFASPYFCPEFTQAVAGVRADVRVVVIENAGRATGFFPYQRARWGSGRPVGGALSDYHGVIAGAGCEWQPGALLRAAGLSVWSFNHLVGGERQFAQYVTGRAASPQIDLSAGYESYAASRRAAGSDYIPKTEGLARKLAREAGEVQFTFHDARVDALEQLMRWKSDQYRRTGKTDVFGLAWTRELLGRIARLQAPGFSGVCSVLSAGERMVAVHLGMRSREALHYWYPAYDPEYAKFSTGIILLLRIAQAAAGSGIQVIDLGKGEAQYKQRLMTGAVEVREGYVELPSLLSAARRLKRAAEARAARGGIAAALRLPLGAMRRLERARRFC